MTRIAAFLVALSGLLLLCGCQSGRPAFARFHAHPAETARGPHRLLVTTQPHTVVRSWSAVERLHHTGNSAVASDETNTPGPVSDAATAATTVADSGPPSESASPAGADGAPLSGPVAAIPAATVSRTTATGDARASSAPAESQDARLTINGRTFRVQLIEDAVPLPHVTTADASTSEELPRLPDLTDGAPVRTAGGTR